MNSDAIEKPERSDLGRDRERQRREDARREQRGEPRDHDVGDDRDRRAPGASANATHAPRDADRDERQQPQAHARVLQHQARRERDPEHDADDRRGLGDRGDEASLRLGEVEDLLVVERRERREADHRRGEERQREPDPPQRAHLPEDAHRLGPRRWLLVGLDDRLLGAAGRAFEVAAAGLLQLAGRGSRTRCSGSRRRRTARASRTSRRGCRRRAGR